MITARVASLASPTITYVRAVRLPKCSLRQSRRSRSARLDVARKAGRALGVDSSTVARRQGALEEALAARLFDRGHEGISASKAAKDLQPVAEEMERVMTRFAANRLEREASGVVRIACPKDMADVVVTPLLLELLQRQPALRVEITHEEQ